MLLEDKVSSYEVMDNKTTTSKLTPASSRQVSAWPATSSGVIKPVPERPEPVYPAMIRPDVLTQLGKPDSLRLGGMMAPLSPMYPFQLQLPPVAGQVPKFLPFGPFLYHSKYPMGKKTFRCPQCRYVTDRKNNLKRHIATMHQDCGKPLECCEIHFKSKAALRDHVMLFHRAGYKCRYCGRNFCRKALLKRHLAVHNGQKDFICSVCDYATSHKSNLERHKKVHGQGHYTDDEEDLDETSTSDDVDVEIIDDQPHHHHHHHQHDIEMLHRHHMHNHLLGLTNGQSSDRFPTEQEHCQGHRDASKSPATPGKTQSFEITRENTNNENDESTRTSSPERQTPTPGTSHERRNATDDVTMAGMNPDLAALYRANKRLFSPYRCPQCPLSFPSHVQLALHARQCKNEPMTSSVNAIATSLPLSQTWPPLMINSHLGLPMGMSFPWMDKSPLAGLQGFHGLNGFSPLTFKHRQDESPVKSFWPFSLQQMSYASPDKNDPILPPKKRLLETDTSMPVDYRTNTSSTH